MNKTLNLYMFLTNFCLGIYFGSIQMLLVTISDYLRINASQTGLLASAYFIGGLIFPIAFGLVSDKIGKKKVLIIGFLLFISGLMGLILSEVFILLLSFMIVIGGGGFIMQSTSADIITEVNAKNKIKMMNYFILFFSLGAVLGPFISKYFMNIFDSWKITIYIVIVLALILMVLISIVKYAFINYELNHENNHKVGFPSKKFLLVALALAMFIYIAIENIAFWLNSYFIEVLKNKTLGVYAVSGFHGLMIVGRYLTGKFEKYQNFFLIGGISLSFVTLLIALLVRNPILNVVSFTLVGLGYSAQWPAIMSQTSEKFKKYSGTALGIVMTFGAIGGITSPIIVGFLNLNLGYWLSFWIYPILIILLLMIELKLKKKGD